MTVPLQNHESEIIGVLQLPSARKTVQSSNFLPADQRRAESLASNCSSALTNRQLIQQMEHPFESFIERINLAIDEKSPCTGGHCQREPKVRTILADAVDAATDDAPLANFRLTDKGRYELCIAALMHDCGKVTTPVHVVDKATKLQTIFDHIHWSTRVSRCSSVMPRCACGVASPRISNASGA